MQRLILLLVVFFLFVGGWSVSLAEEAARHFVAIGTGGVSGVYFPTGLAICRLVNREREQHKIVCTAESSGGSVTNLAAINSGVRELGIIQSDWKYWQAETAAKQAETSAGSETVRTVFSLYAEPFTLVVRADSGIETLADLLGKRINIGSPGSGQRQTMEILMDALDWTTADFAQVTELGSSEQSEALCSDEFDAMVFTVGHPNQSIMEATASCEAKLVNVTGPEIEQLLADHPYYLPAIIAGGTYHGNESPVETFAVTATFVAATALETEVVYQIVKAIFENFAEFRRQHPAFSKLNKPTMIQSGFPAPLHSGAIRYFREAGLM